MTAFEAIGSKGKAVLLAAVLAAACASARADDAPAATKDWSWGSIYKADLLHGRSTDSGIGNLGLRVNADAGALLGWDDTTLHAELLWNHGGKPNRRIGTTQGISNLEVAQSAARVYASWIEHEYKGSGTRVLFGLYDLNSEFYSTDASGLLIHPSFGIGIDFSQSGRNGPSIFPNLGLGLRVQQPLGGNFYLQGAMIDGVPGDPQSPGRTVVRLSRNDGALLVAELGWQDRDGDGQKPGRWGFGVWHYTQPSDRIDGTGRARNQGVYALAQAVLGEHGTGLHDRLCVRRCSEPARQCRRSRLRCRHAGRSTAGQGRAGRVHCRHRPGTLRSGLPCGTGGRGRVGGIERNGIRARRTLATAADAGTAAAAATCVARRQPWRRARDARRAAVRVGARAGEPLTGLLTARSRRRRPVV